jgi:hypothetical protein
MRNQCGNKRGSPDGRKRSDGAPLIRDCPVLPGSGLARVAFQIQEPRVPLLLLPSLPSQGSTEPDSVSAKFQARTKQPTEINL